MDAGQTYLWLVQGAKDTASDPFDIHVIASVLALGINEAVGGAGTVCERAGLDGRILDHLVREMFPGVAPEFPSFPGDQELVIDAEEQSIRDILWMYASSGSELERNYTSMIARRCSCPHHLWQDLGLPHRAELTVLMERHFRTLAERNNHDMKWKKFLYRMVCGSSGFSLCTSPVCSECEDFENCFGSEDGETLLARIRNGKEEVV
jgi:nitrogen fixation protein NifQ